MKILPEPVSFEWDSGNIDKNWLKHQVTTKEAEEVFDSKPDFIFKSEKHSTPELRYMIWGITKQGRKLAVIFTLREDRIRIISARDMDKKERIEYEKNI